MEGRYNRAKYFWTILAINVVTFGISFTIGYAIGASGGDTTTAGVVGFIVGIGASVVCALQVVKRLHDLNRPGTHYWLAYIPIYNIYFSLLILFKRGTDGENQYGLDPLAVE